MAKNSYRPFHPKVNLTELNFSTVDFNSTLQNIILNVRPLIEQGREYSYIAASLLSEELRLEVLNTVGITASLSELPEQEKLYPTLSEYVKFGTEQGQLSSRLRELDLEYLNSCIRHDRNYLFDYLGSHTLYDRYLLHKQGQRYETFQHFWMRVAMGVALAEKNAQEATKCAAEFYEVISQMLYVPSTPTLFNSGTKHSQMSSCFLTTTQDDLLDIYRQYSDNAMLSKYAGGLGNDWSNIRASGSWIKGTNGRSQGVIPFIKVQDSSTIAVNQGGKRKGAVCAYLETWHLDIEDFLELRKNTGDERRRTHDMNTANWVPDLFLERVEQNAEWTLFCPSEAKDLHDSYGEDFKKLYENYEKKAELGELQNFRKVSSVQLWRKILTMIFETGHPWVTFKDPCNLRSSQRHIGVVHSSNLCTEITLNTNAEETAVCNLGSINLKAVFQSENPAKTLAHAVSVGMRMLDNVISENFYPIKSAETANHRHRPVGLGFMGFQDVLYMKRIPYSKPEAMWLSEKIAEYISFHAIKASANLAKERGSYSSYQGSTWSKGKVPKDTVCELGVHVNYPVSPTQFKDNNGELRACPELLFADGFTESLNWDEIRSQVAQGMRNSLCLAVAPTATISNISNCTQSIEPTYKNLYVKSNMGGDYTIINEYLIDDLKALGLWNAELSRELKRADGDLNSLNIPEDIKELYNTAFDIEPEQLIRCAALRQIYIDQSMSLNLYMSAPSGRKIDEMYRYAWHSGLKTTYYLRTKAATSVEKSSISNRKNEIKLPVEAKACSIDNPECESCQ
ncbi:ribonucleoside-diphosphate reductase subunit alpha [Fluviispira multicolorata]|uniref:Ribonucleoside-diphosphate reductase n=1 Tax=Fluviispira multicolorata TaxID=2654512 RepID=A0A833N571_9BACT|nr:ribonucleoside-diphosphate reductase subunit alpha [Fluviispira multicolorata]KAB8033517.1 ribonucleoside-diphosphate reductase subunit alpha [Fluviispira multicolorata]